MHNHWKVSNKTYLHDIFNMKPYQKNISKLLLSEANESENLAEMFTGWCFTKYLIVLFVYVFICFDWKFEMATTAEGKV